MTSPESPETKEHPLDHPDAKRSEAIIPEIVKESDRGAVLVGASMVEEYLSELFDGVRPQSMSNRVFRHF